MFDEYYEILVNVRWNVVYAYIGVIFGAIMSIIDIDPPTKIVVKNYV